MFRSSLMFRSLPSFTSRFLSAFSRPSLINNSSSVLVKFNPQPSLTSRFPQLFLNNQNSCIVSIFPDEVNRQDFLNIEDEQDNTIYMDSVLRKRRLKMKKHKLRKRRRAQRSLKKRLGKL